jgi:hypothetical protein
MSITLFPVPTASAIKLKFPEFAGVADGTIEFAIEEACLSVDDTWIPAQGTLALMYLTAHHLMVTVSRAESGTGARIRSESILGMSITYDNASTTKPDAGDYSTTPYGSQFQDLLDRNVPAVLLL